MNAEPGPPAHAAGPVHDHASGQGGAEPGRSASGGQVPGAADTAVRYVVRQPRVTPWLAGAAAALMILPGWLVDQAVVSGKHRLGDLEGAFIVAGFTTLLLCVFFSARRKYGERDGRMVLAVEDAGFYLKDAERQIGWASVAEVVTFRVFVPYPEGVLSDRRLVVVECTADGSLPPPPARRPPDPSGWGVTARLHQARFRPGDLAAAVHAYAPDVRVWDTGEIK
jgi:hypothetical protein